MNDHTHLWVHKRNLAGRVIERCWDCGMARRPRLPSSEAHENAVVGLQRAFKRVYARPIAEMMPSIRGLHV